MSLLYNTWLKGVTAGLGIVVEWCCRRIEIILEERPGRDRDGSAGCCGMATGCSRRVLWQGSTIILFLPPACHNTLQVLHLSPLKGVVAGIGIMAEGGSGVPCSMPSYVLWYTWERPMCSREHVQKHPSHLAPPPSEACHARYSVRTVHSTNFSGLALLRESSTTMLGIYI